MSHTDNPSPQRGVSRRAVLAAAGVGGAVAAVPLTGTGLAAAASSGPSGVRAGDPTTTPRVAGLHTQFGADASRDVVVSWHTLQPVTRPQVHLSRSGSASTRAIGARTVSYTDAKSGQVVYAHHATLTGLRAATDYDYAAVHQGAEPETGSFRTAPRRSSPSRASVTRARRPPASATSRPRG
jgi:phosphodiesterase/alkaline phosphatase D-like protein